MNRTKSLTIAAVGILAAFVAAAGIASELLQEVVYAPISTTSNLRLNSSVKHLDMLAVHK